MSKSPHSWRRTWVKIGVAATATALVAMSGQSIAAAEQAADKPQIVGAQSDNAIKDSYIVVFKDGVSANSANSKSREHSRRYNADVTHRYTSALRGYAATMNERNAKRVAEDPSVAYVEQDQTVGLAGDQTNPPSWGLDRVDQRELPLDDLYSYSTNASNVDVYVIDTGIRMSHNDFEGRATSGYDAIDGGAADDCNGHGTHVAGTVGGAAYGVAKKVNLVAVRVLDCDGYGSYSGIIDGIDWVTNNASGPSVTNMSLGGSASSAIDDAVQNSIASGITYAVAAGNSDDDACDYSPARVPEALTVGATDSSDERPTDWPNGQGSNYGTCLDLFAPGDEITSAWIGSDSDTNTISGTSMASPHVAGAAALYLADNTGASPSQVHDAIVHNATTDVVINPGSGSPNRLLYTGSGSTDPEPSDCTGTNDTDVSIPDGGVATSDITISDCGRKASSSSTITVDIKHTYRGDLVIDLIAPDGTAYRLKNSDYWDSADNVQGSVTRDLSSHDADGTWTLRVEDVYVGDTGYIDSWTLEL